jgi:hypothetical protein
VILFSSSHLHSQQWGPLTGLLQQQIQVFQPRSHHLSNSQQGDGQSIIANSHFACCELLRRHSEC